MIAALLDYPFASLVNSIEVLDGGKLRIGREIEGGSREINEIDLPCVLSIQTGINEPRYVGMRGIRLGMMPELRFTPVLRCNPCDGLAGQVAPWWTAPDGGFAPCETVVANVLNESIRLRR